MNFLIPPSNALETSEEETLFFKKFWFFTVSITFPNVSRESEGTV